MAINLFPVFEKYNEPLAPRDRFIKRQLKCAGFGLLATVMALIIGMAGYHHFEGMLWVDAFVNASMILSGMGPLSILVTSAGKIFAGCYALFSGLIFIFSIGFIFSPIVHRFFHKLHLNVSDQ